MGDQDLPRQYRASRGERNSIIPEDRISLGQKQIPRSLLPSPFSFLPSFYQPASRIFADSPPAARDTSFPLSTSLSHDPAICTRCRCIRGKDESSRPTALLKLGKLRVQFLPANAIDIDFLHFRMLNST